MKYVFIIAGVLLIALTIAAGLIWVERRLLSVWQDRLGPNRVGPFGLGQVIADTIKLFLKRIGYLRFQTDLYLLWLREY